MKKILTIIASIIIGTIGCRKTDQNFKNEITIENKVPITQQSIKNQIKFAEDRFKEIGIELAKLSKEKEFRRFIHNEVRKKFDGEYEVLIQDLQKDPIWGSRLSTPTINNALNAFKNINGNSYYPHIYIPRLLKEEKNLNARETDDYVTEDDPPTYTFYGGDDPEVETYASSYTNLTYPGYALNTSSQLEYVGQIDEAYADENEVWVLAINESVDDHAQLLANSGDGTVAPSCTDVDCDLAENSSNTPIFDNSAGHATVNCKIVDMVIKDPKEGWVSGAAEVSIRAKLSCYNDRERGMPDPAQTLHYRSNQYSNLLGKLIRKFKRKEIKHQDIINVNYTLQTDWPNGFPLIDPIYFDYVIFERDAWPAASRPNTRYGRSDQLNTSLPNADNWEQKYRSDEKNGYTWHFPYSVGSFVNSTFFSPYPSQYYYTGYVNNSEISFTTTGF
jgi:hypothetical protein